MRNPVGTAYLELFLYLQVLDLLTTVLGLHLGLIEANPFVDWMIQSHPVAGVAASKLFAIVLAGGCIWINKHHLIRWINYWYAALVVWNLSLLLHMVYRR